VRTPRPRSEELKATWQDRLVLNPGETVRPTHGITTGNLGQNDVEIYDVIDAQSQVTGTATCIEATLLKPPFKTSCSLVQKDIAGKVIVDLRW
jgi:hypothetical protein